VQSMTQESHPNAQPTASYFTEHLGVINALEENYQNAEEDFQSIQAIHDVYDHMKDLCKQKEYSAREIINGLVEQCEQAQGCATYPKDDEEHSSLVKRYEGEINETSSHVHSMESQLRALEEQEVEVEKKMRQLVETWNRLAEWEQREPQLRQLLSLYIHVTKITWNLGTLNDNLVRGTIDNPDAGVFEDIVAGDDFDAVSATWNKLLLKS
jgi:DNA repair exonuclease SbcCD ATPase subunit